MNAEKVRRFVKKWMGFCKSLMLWVIARTEVQTTPVEILVLHPSTAASYPVRPIIERLEQAGHRVQTVSLEKTFSELLMQRPFLRREKRTAAGLSDLLLEMQSRFLIEKYVPRLIVTHMDASPLSKSLRLFANEKGTPVANISHSVTDSTALYEMFDFDYYFVFGKSSVQNAQQSSKRIGHTRLVLAGSPLISSEYGNMLPAPTQPTVCILSDGFSHHADQLLNQLDRILQEWLMSRPPYQILVKPHPLESEEQLRKRFSKWEFVEILPKNVSLKNAIEQSNVTITGWSNASIESAALGRPPILIKPEPDFRDYLSYEQFFGERPASALQLSQKLSSFFQNSLALNKSCQEFRDFHLSVFPNSQDYITQCLICILKSRIDFPTEEI